MPITPGFERVGLWFTPSQEQSDSPITQFKPTTAFSIPQPCRLRLTQVNIGAILLSGPFWSAHPRFSLCTILLTRTIITTPRHVVGHLSFVSAEFISNATGLITPRTSIVADLVNASFRLSYSSGLVLFIHLPLLMGVSLAFQFSQTVHSSHLLQWGLRCPLQTWMERLFLTSSTPSWKVSRDCASGWDISIMPELLLSSQQPRFRHYRFSVDCYDKVIIFPT